MLVDSPGPRLSIEFVWLMLILFLAGLKFFVLVDNFGHDTRYGSEPSGAHSLDTSSGLGTDPPRKRSRSPGSSRTGRS